MTTQFPEKLRYQGKDVRLWLHPLQSYFVLAGIPSPFTFPSTALWRGYIGNWEIVNNRLYLTSLKGMLESGDDATLASIFPEFPNRVFAHWFSGNLILEQDTQRKKIHSAEGCNAFMRDQFLSFERGVIVATPECPTKEDITDVIVRRAKENHLQGIDQRVTVVAKKKRRFYVERDELLERLTVQEIEKREVVVDPLEAAPNIPFGHLYSAWREFLDRFPKGAELWSFSSWYRPKGAMLDLFRAGYVVVQSGAPGKNFSIVLNHMTSEESVRAAEYISSMRKPKITPDAVEVDIYELLKRMKDL